MMAETESPTEWVYLVNDRSPEWGYPCTALEFFEGEHLSNSYHVWTLPRLLKDFRAGDFIWVRATLPLGAFIGLGEVISDLAPDTGGTGYLFDVYFDELVSAAMVAKPIHGSLEKHTQATRRLTPGELRALHRQVGAPASARLAPTGKVRRMQEVVARQGQADFRRRLIRAYDGRCAVTGCAVVEVLQAAHIAPYDGLPSNTVPNGLLLRADIHDLFDRGLLWVTDSLRVAVRQNLRNTEYGSFHGKRLRLPAAQNDRPDARKIGRHRTDIALQQD